MRVLVVVAVRAVGVSMRRMGKVAVEPHPMREPAEALFAKRLDRNQLRSIGAKLLMQYLERLRHLAQLAEVLLFEECRLRLGSEVSAHVDNVPSAREGILQVPHPLLDVRDA